MNERIRELARQAREYANSKEPYEKIKNKAWIDVYDEKFAELIVRECIDTIVRDTANYPGEGMMAYYQGVQDAGKSIKQHFGVEERKGWVCPKCGIDRTKDVCPKGYTATMTGDCPMTATPQSGVES